MINALISKEFKSQIPHYKGAILQSDLKNSPTSDELWNHIETCVENLRKQYDTETIKQRPEILAVRSAYKTLGKDPSRYRPSCEQLARRVLQGKELYKINTIVDIGNLLSLISGYSIAAIDAQKITGTDIILGIGKENEPYEAIGRGTLNIANIPVFRDALSAFSTPTSDSNRTMCSEDTSKLLLIVNGYDGNKKSIEETLQSAQTLLKKFAFAENFSIQKF